MPKLSSKNQITLPIKFCKEANIKSGDILEAFICDGNITLVKKDSNNKYQLDDLLNECDENAPMLQDLEGRIK